ncbi:MAG: BrnT family toxin [Verrucomicrobiaceae bacterium]
MDLDFADTPFDTKFIKPHEIEEIFEDPFSIRLIPDTDREDGETRFYLLGRTIGNRSLFLCFWTDGKRARVIGAREMSEDESAYYDRKLAEIK